ncbi:MAG: hypothetical protein DMD61_10340 [Gemmatimonadetes bacterium]|nr:MAG: hypothetical protein DMD61_10340 [Gemmatimonadota bacterium]
MPVIPGPNSSSVSACWRKFTRRRRRSCISRLPLRWRAPRTRRRAARIRRGRDRRRVAGAPESPARSRGASAGGRSRKDPRLPPAASPDDAGRAGSAARGL